MMKEFVFQKYLDVRFSRSGGLKGKVLCAIVTSG